MGLVLRGSGAGAQDTPPAPPVPALPPVVVTAPPATAASSEVLIPGKDFELRPQGRPADVIRLVPGLAIGQHQGGGKAEQYFLRGFDADHGTDVAVFVDGFPVNLRSHAHGQGYADLHFLIPETVRRVEAVKGPYHVELGDFATAGAVNFITLDTVEENLAQAAGGMFGTQRYLALLSPTREGVKTLIALEGYISDGPFEHAQNYQRFNGLLKASARLAEDTDLSVWLTHHRGAWHASGQVPERAIRAGLIGRFGALDDSEGGWTERTAVNGTLRWKPTEAQTVTVQAYAQYYTLRLFSNFTFFLDDPDSGDGIEQIDRRWMAGLDARWEHTGQPLGVAVTTTAGVHYRIDTPRVVLGRQADRHELGRTQDVNVVEQSYSPFMKFEVVPLPWLRVVTGARGDIFSYDVRDNLNGEGQRLTGTATRTVPSVKANVILEPWRWTELFANFGTGFHSNDARAVILDPRLTALPQARGYEFGVRTRPHPRLQLSATYWVLNLKSELVFAGDDGTTEARGPSQRHGWEFNGRLRLLDWLTFSGDVTLSQAKFDNGDAVPLAPRLTARADLTARLPGGLSASLEMRRLGDRFASEDREQIARGYTLFDVTARYRHRALEAFVSIENLLSTDYRESQFFFTSRLPGEPAGGVPDIHFTPGHPRTVLGGIAVRF